MTVGSGKEELALSGTFFGSQPRLVKIQEHNIDASPAGHLLIFENTDAPGVVGALGQLLGAKGINIASMNLSRNQVGGQALSILNLDSAADESVIQEILKIDGIQSARAVEL